MTVGQPCALRKKLTAPPNIIVGGLTDGGKLFLMEPIATYLPAAETMDSEGTVMEQIADITSADYTNAVSA